MLDTELKTFDIFPFLDSVIDIINKATNPYDINKRFDMVKEILENSDIPEVKVFVKSIDRYLVYFILTDPKDPFYGSIVYYDPSSLFWDMNKQGKFDANSYFGFRIGISNHKGPTSAKTFKRRKGMLYLPGYDGPTIYKKNASTQKIKSYVDMMNDTLKLDDNVAFTTTSSKMFFGRVSKIDHMGVHISYRLEDGSEQIHTTRSTKHCLVLNDDILNKATIWKLSH